MERKQWAAQPVLNRLCQSPGTLSPLSAVPDPLVDPLSLEVTPCSGRTGANGFLVTPYGAEFPLEAGDVVDLSGIPMDQMRTG